MYVPTELHVQEVKHDDNKVQASPQLEEEESTKQDIMTEDVGIIGEEKDVIVVPQHIFQQFNITGI